jgi:diguanylate cyclase (GGDEF)-like protein
VEKITPTTPGSRRRLLSQRFLLSLLVLAVLGALALIQAFAIQKSGLRQAELARFEVLERARLVASGHDQWLAESRNLLVAMASALRSLPAMDQGCSRLFRQFIDQVRGFDTMLLVDPAGNLLCAPDEVSRPINLADRSYFRRVMETKAFSVGEYIVDRVSGKRVLPLAVPVLGESGAIDRVVVARRELDWLGSVLERQGFLSTARVTILDRRGIVLGQYPAGSAKGEKLYPDIDVVKAIRSRSSGVAEATIQKNDHRLIGFTRLNQVSGDVYVLVDVSMDAAMLPVKELVSRGNLFLALTVSLVLVTLWTGLGVLILQPLERLRAAMHRATGGDLSVRMGETGVSSEMRSISSAFDTMATALGEARATLEELATIDPLLGIANRRKFDDALGKEWGRARRGRRPVALLMIDLDRFKGYNDLYGHPAGDDCLKRVADAAGAALHRPGDLLARYGGEELACVLPETDLDGAVVVAESIRARVYEKSIAHQGGVDGRVTVSIGVAAVVPQATLSVEVLIDAADRSLYAAKSAGRNRVVTAVTGPELRRAGGGA